MRPRTRPLALVATALLALPCAADAKPPRHYSVGLAAESVAVDANGTFDHGQLVYLGGYGLGNGQIDGTGLTYDDGRSATGNLDGGPQVRAAVISAGRQSFAIADIENQGCFTQNKQGHGLITMRREAAAEIKRQTGHALPADRIYIQCNHSHGGPDLIGVWGGVPTAYLAFVEAQTVKAIVAAYKSQRPADLWYGTAQSGVEGRAGGPPEDKDPLLTNQMLNDPIGNNDLMDDELRILQARDPDTGAAFASILNLNAHPTVLGSSNRKATGDWPQLANKLMGLDAETFGSQAMTIVGTLGRQQPARGDCRDDSIPQAQRSDSNPAWAICKLTQYSQRVIARAKVALSRATRIEGRPEVVAKTYFIADPATNVGILALNDVGELIGAPVMRSTLPPWRTANVVGTITGSARIGNVLLSSMPGEAYPQIPLVVRDISKRGKLKGFMTAGLSNDQLGYIIAPVPDAYPYVLIRGAQGNDNILFNVSQTLGERLTCSLLRGAGEVTGNGSAFRDAYVPCLLFVNDALVPEGADVKLAGIVGG